MILELDRETIDFLCKKQLTFNQYAICLLVHKQDLATIIKYTSEVGHIGTCLIPKNKQFVREIDDLIDRGFIINTHESSKDIELDYLVVTEKFTKNLFKDLRPCAQALWEIYPKQIIINGITYEAKACDYDEFVEKYLKAINNDIKIHNDIVMPHITNTIKTNNGNPKMKIMNYVGGRNWEGANTTITQHKTRLY